MKQTHVSDLTDINFFALWISKLTTQNSVIRLTNEEGILLFALLEKYWKLEINSNLTCKFLYNQEFVNLLNSFQKINHYLPFFYQWLIKKISKIETGSLINNISVKFLRSNEFPVISHNNFSSLWVILFGLSVFLIFLTIIFQLSISFSYLLMFLFVSLMLICYGRYERKHFYLYLNNIFLSEQKWYKENIYLPPESILNYLESFVFWNKNLKNSFIKNDTKYFPIRIEDLLAKTKILDKNQIMVHKLFLEKLGSMKKTEKEKIYVWIVLG